MYNDFYFEPNSHNKYVNNLYKSLVKYPVIYQIAKIIYLYIQAIEWFILKFAGVFPSQYFRLLLYKSLGMKIGKGSVFFGGIEIRCPTKITIGNYTAIGHGCVLDGRGGLEIGNHVVLSSGAWIWSVQHIPNDPFFRIEVKKVVIENYVWISSRSIILPGKTIGQGAVVSAGSVVTHDVPEYKIVGGNPAKIIAERIQDLRYSLHDVIPMI
jgi:acetyltransferase-like isoleucine patch superfamily enzyme